MKNVEITRTGNLVTVTFDATKNFGPSNSRKTTIVASTEGNVTVHGTDGSMKLGLNVFAK